VQEQLNIKDVIKEPDTIEGLNIPQSIVIDIILRLLFNEGNVAFSRFVEVLKIHNRIIDNILMWMQKEHLADVSKGTSEIGRFGYVFTLTDAGKERARDALERSQYVGPVPVSIISYNQGIELQTSERRQISSTQVIEALKLLILPTNFHRYIGPAINSCNSLFLYGPPGNGKTSLAEAIANALMVPLYMVTYDTLIGAYLGETASNLAKLFEYARTRQCVLFFDEFETLGKERGDRHETGEIKRVVSSLLMNIDALPSYVVVIAATNHEALLDIAAWRRFQVKIELGKPSVDDIQCWLSSFEKRMRFSFNIQLGNLAKRLLGKSYAEVEEFALSIYRQYILKGFATDTRTLTEFRLNQDSSLSMHKNSSM